MIIFNASDYGIVPNNDITLQLIELFNKANKTNGEKNNRFEKVHIILTVKNAVNICFILQILSVTKNFLQMKNRI